MSVRKVMFSGYMPCITIFFAEFCRFTALPVHVVYMSMNAMQVWRAPCNAIHCRNPSGRHCTQVADEHIASSVCYTCTFA